MAGRPSNFEFYVNQLEKVGDFVAIPADNPRQLSSFLYHYKKNRKRNKRGLDLKAVTRNGKHYVKAVNLMMPTNIPDSEYLEIDTSDFIKKPRNGSYGNIVFRINAHETIEFNVVDYRGIKFINGIVYDEYGSPIDYNIALDENLKNRIKDRLFS